MAHKEHPGASRAHKSEAPSHAKKKAEEVTPAVAEEEKEPAPVAAEAAAAPSAEEALQVRLLRLQADFDNFRKRTLRDRSETALRANEELLTALLPVLDHFELGLNTARRHHTERAVIDGFQLVYDQMLNALKRFGLTPIDAEGEAFDPHWHEAATHVPSEEHPEDVVLTQTRRGYKLGDRLLRAAQVVVSSGPREASREEPEA